MKHKIISLLDKTDKINVRDKYGESKHIKIYPQINVYVNSCTGMCNYANKDLNDFLDYIIETFGIELI